MPTKVLIWNEGRHEKKNPRVAEIYPDGIHGAIATHLRRHPDFDVATATLDTRPDLGLTAERLNNTDVLLWWGHLHHDDVPDELVTRIQKRVLNGMGLLVLHSAHYSKIFKRLMGTTCEVKWREERDEREILWVVKPGHPILHGIDDHLILPAEEMYGEYFDIPQPEEVLLISSFAGGEVFRSACTFLRGAGRILYFRPGHETFPTYHNPQVLRIIENGVRWAAPTPPPKPLSWGERKRGWFDAR